MLPPRRVLAAFVALSAASLAARSAGAGPVEANAHAAVLRALPSAKHSLLDGVRSASKDGAVAISARFEREDNGLRLSIHTARNGLAADAEYNLIEEHAGDPTAHEWRPSTRVVPDRAHVARASEQLTLMRLTKLSLADVIQKSSSVPGATVFSVTPILREGRGIFVLLAAVGEEVVTVSLDLVSGEPVDGAWPRRPLSPESTPLVGRTLPEPKVDSEAAWVGVRPIPPTEAAAGRVVLVVSNSYG